MVRMALHETYTHTADRLHDSEHQEQCVCIDETKEYSCSVHAAYCATATAVPRVQIM